ncbi:hypothetical protein PR048_024824 [Dryococelus australis]|uniref:Uncharacterized protein n=1 Tax=Dryococelus australis TaxID=614101 RepID=A0ABQ9GPQ7_9NEOP|nr:hypothetical protein PR048_024824 [Dryococelus australis]
MAVTIDQRPRQLRDLWHDYFLPFPGYANTANIVFQAYLWSALPGKVVTTRVSMELCRDERAGANEGTLSSTGGRGGLVVRLLASQQANQVRFSGWSLPDFCTWVSSWTTPLVGGFSRGSPVFPRPFIMAQLHTHSSGIDQHDSHMQKSWGTQPGIAPGSPWWGGGDYSNYYTTAVSEMSMDERQNVTEGETGDPRVNTPTSGIVRHDSHFRKSDSVPAGESLELRNDWMMQQSFEVFFIWLDFANNPSNILKSPEDRITRQPHTFPVPRACGRGHYLPMLSSYIALPCDTKRLREKTTERNGARTRGAWGSDPTLTFGLVTYFRDAFRGAMMAERLYCSSPNKANHLQSSPWSLPARGNRAGRCR